MGNYSVPKFIFRLSRFPVYRGSVLGRFYCNMLCRETEISKNFYGTLQQFTVLLQIAILAHFEIPFSSYSYLVSALAPVPATNWRRSPTAVPK